MLKSRKKSQKKAQREFHKFLDKTMNVGPAFADTVFSLLSGDMEDMRIEYSDGKEFKDFGQASPTVFLIVDDEMILDGYEIAQVLMKIARDFGSEVVEQACKEGFISIGLTPTKSCFHPPQFIKGYDLAEVVNNIIRIAQPESNCDTGDKPVETRTYDVGWLEHHHTHPPSPSETQGKLDISADGHCSAITPSVKAAFTTLLKGEYYHEGNL